MNTMPTEKKITKQEVQDEIAIQCDKIKDLLLRKNENYGNSALDPERIFSQLNASEGIKVRIDDKLSRIRALQSTEDSVGESISDTISDLIGYLILLKVSLSIEKESLFRHVPSVDDSIKVGKIKSDKIKESIDEKPKEANKKFEQISVEVCW